MAPKPGNSAWADDLSDEVQPSDTDRLLRSPVESYQSTQERLMKDHEEGLGLLGEAIKRQKYMAGELANEVDLHNEIIEDIDAGVSRTAENIQKNTRNIKLVTRKSDTCFLWSIIVILAIVIMTLFFL